MAETNVRAESGSATTKRESEPAATAAEKVGEMAEKAGEKTEELKERAESAAESQKDRVAEKGSAVAAALRAAGDTLRERDADQLGDVTDGLAEDAERFSGYVRDHDVRGLFTDLEDLARRNPGAFLGTTLAAGLLAGRFLRSSSPDGSRGGSR